jgi:T-complex protein 1 subunit alpha
MKAVRASTLICRDANDYFLDDIERAIHYFLCVIKSVLESNSLVAGGGAIEVAISNYVNDYARTLCTHVQLSNAEYSEALLLIPNTIYLKASMDAIDLISKLRVIQNAAQKAYYPN